MSLPATGVWEVQTTGNDNNGGMFDPSVAGAGTDYTYGAGKATFAYTDLVVDAVTNTKVTSATRSFVAADVGNTIQIVSGTGWTTGFYNIRSVASGAATLDRSPAAVGTTGGTGTLGGALASPGKAAGVVVAGNDVWVASGTYSIGSGTANTAGNRVALTVGGADNTNASFWTGYSTVRGDRSTRPVFQAGVSVTNISLFSQNAQAYCALVNIEFDGAGNTGNTGAVVNANFGYAENCKASNCLTAGFAIASGNVYAIMCSAISCATGFSITSPASMYACTATSCTGDGFITTGALLYYCISSGNNRGFAITSNSIPGISLGCTAYNNSGNGFMTLDTARNTFAVNCLSYGNGGFGYSTSVVQDLTPTWNCAGGANTSGNFTSLQLPRLVSFVALTSNPFTNAAAGDFSLNNAAGGGAACRAAGIPGVFPGGLTTGYLDIGTAQHQDAGGGTVVGLRGPIMANTLIYEE